MVMLRMDAGSERVNKSIVIFQWLFCMRYPFLDASVGDSFVADPSWAALGPSGFEHDDYGLRMAGGRERNSKSTTKILYAVQTTNRTEPQNWTTLTIYCMSWTSRCFRGIYRCPSVKCLGDWVCPQFSSMRTLSLLTGRKEIQMGKLKIHAICYVKTLC